MMTVRRLLASAIACAALVTTTATALTTAMAPAALANDEATLWSAVGEGRAFAIMRHALAPGFSDPANFKVDDCSTQRNLNETGRDQARAIGQRFRDNGIVSARVMTSQWCRCRDTAERLGLGPVEELPALNSFFEHRGRRGQQTANLKAWLAETPRDTPLVLVTHQVNISALTGRGTSSGETVVAALNDDGTVAVLGSIRTRW